MDLRRRWAALLVLAACSSGPTPPPAPTPPYAPALVAGRLLPVAGDLELRRSLDNLTRPAWSAGEPAVLERSGAARAVVEVWVGAAPVGGAASPDRRPEVVTLSLQRDGDALVVPAALAASPGDATGPRWHLFRADVSGVPAGRWEARIALDGRPPGPDHPWWVSRPIVWQDADDGGRPNVVLITIDTLRADRLGCYGHDRPTSPRIDAFAREATLFERATSQASWTLPSLASLLTGRYSESHGVVHRDQRLDRSLVSIVERFAEAGYVTGAVMSGTFTDSLWGLDQGFDAYADLGAVTDDHAAPVEDPTGREAMLPAEQRITSAEVTDRAIAWLEEQRGRRFVLLAHYFDPHRTYVQHEGTAERFPAREVPWRLPLTTTPQPASIPTDAARYEGEIAFTDRHVGRLLDFLGDMRDDTVVVITADHGEEFHERLAAGHGHALFAELVRVPLLLRVPGSRPGRVASPVGLVDLAPTFAELCGLPPLPVLQGRSLLPLVRDPAARRGGPVYSAVFPSAPPPVARTDAGRGAQWHHRVDDDDGTLVVMERGPGSPRTSWFEPDDHEERHDRLDRHPERARALDEGYRAVRTALLAERPAGEPVDLRTLDRLLEALGYAEEPPPSP